MRTVWLVCFVFVAGTACNHSPSVDSGKSTDVAQANPAKDVGIDGKKADAAQPGVDDGKKSAAPAKNKETAKTSEAAAPPIERQDDVKTDEPAPRAAFKVKIRPDHFQLSPNGAELWHSDGTEIFATTLETGKRRSALKDSERISTFAFRAPNRLLTGGRLLKLWELDMPNKEPAPIDPRAHDGPRYIHLIAVPANGLKADAAHREVIAVSDRILAGADWLIFDFAKEDGVTGGRSNLGMGAIAFSADGEYFAKGGADWKVVVYRTGQNQPLWTRKHDPRHVVDLCFSPDGALLAVSGYQMVTIMDARSGAPLSAHENCGGRSVAFLGSSDWIAATSDKQMIVKNLKTKSQTTVNAHGLVSISADHKWLAARTGSDHVGIWRIQDLIAAANEKAPKERKAEPANDNPANDKSANDKPANDKPANDKLANKRSIEPIKGSDDYRVQSPPDGIEAIFPGQPRVTENPTVFTFRHGVADATFELACLTFGQPLAIVSGNEEKLKAFYATLTKSVLSKKNGKLDKSRDVIHEKRSARIVEWTHFVGNLPYKNDMLMFAVGDTAYVAVVTQPAIPTIRANEINGFFGSVRPLNRPVQPKATPEEIDKQATDSVGDLKQAIVGHWRGARYLVAGTLADRAGEEWWTFRADGTYESIRFIGTLRHTMTGDWKLVSKDKVELKEKGGVTRSHSIRCSSTSLTILRGGEESRLTRFDLPASASKGAAPPDMKGTKAIHVVERTAILDKTCEKDTKRRSSYRKLYSITFEAGASYQIDMKSKVFDTYLRLENADGQEVAYNDDFDSLDSRIVYKAPRSGDYNIIATTYASGATGQFNLTISYLGAGKAPAPGKNASLALGTWQLTGRDTSEWQGKLVLVSVDGRSVDAYCDWQSSNGSSGRETFKGDFDPVSRRLQLRSVRLQNARGTIVRANLFATISEDGRSLTQGAWAGPFAASGSWSAIWLNATGAKASP